MIKYAFTVLLLISIFFVPDVSLASISYGSGQGWASYSKNGIGYGFIQDSLLYRYYGGQVFQANDDFISSGINIEGCWNVASTTPGDSSIAISIFENDTYNASQSIDLASWSYIGTWRNYTEFCELGDVVETTLSGSYYFEDRTYQFTGGKWYAFVIDDPAIHEDFKYTRTSPDINAISICGDGNDGFCGGTVITNSTSTYGLWLSFDGLASAESIYGACVIATFPYFDIQQCLSNWATWAFIPDQSSINQISNISFASTSPFSYLYQLNGYLVTLRDGSATQTPKIIINTPVTNVTIFSVASSTEILGSGASYIKQFLTWGIWFMALFVAIFEIYYFIRRSEN